MPIPSKRLIRIFCDLGSSQPVIDKFSNQPPRIARGSPTVFQLGVGIFGAAADEIASQAISVTLQIRDSQDLSSPIRAQKTVLAASFAALAAGDWDNDVSQHAQIELTAAEANLAAGSFWLAIWFTNAAGDAVTLAFGPIVVFEDGAAAAGTPPDPVTAYYTKAQVDALFLAAMADGLLMKSGSVSLANGASGGSVSFGTAFGSAPAMVLAVVEMPDGNGAMIFPAIHSKTAAGFAFALSGLTPDANHVLKWRAFA